MAENVRSEDADNAENEIKLQMNVGFSGKRESLSYCDLGHTGCHVEQYAHSKSAGHLPSELALPVTSTSNSAIPQIKHNNFLITAIHRVFDHCKVIYYKLIKEFFFLL